jgi:hypothetical protein
VKICHFFYEGPDEALVRRQLYGEAVGQYLERQLIHFGNLTAARAVWKVYLGKTLLFDVDALHAIEKTLSAYRGTAAEIRFTLCTDPLTTDHYYSLGAPAEGERMTLPIRATRQSGTDVETLALGLESHLSAIPFPAGLCPEALVPLPRFLLLAYTNDFDLLFANQIALVCELTRRVKHSPVAWVRGLSRRYPKGLSARIASGFRHVHRTARIHPTAVIEGSVIGPDVQIGAHAVVRYSYVGREARLHDGAKVEFSVVGARTWLMHDLVLYRSYTEEDVFLIHGPYQFSAFQSKSAAFATILMDYRPDGKPIRVMLADVPREYRGRFLGSVLQEGAKTLGGSLVAPGLVIPPQTWLAADGANIHRQPAGEVLRERPQAPTIRRDLEN